MPRLFVIAFAVLALLVHAGRARFSRGARRSLPLHLRATLERLGPPFVKLGQALSLRRDLVPDDVTEALQGLQDDVAPFPAIQARREIERELAPGIRAQIDRDMRLLVAVLRSLGCLVPAVRRYDVVSLAREIWVRLQIETNLRQEAMNVRRFVDGFRDQPLAHVPDVEEVLCTETVMVQAFSHGVRIDDPRLRAEGSRLARALIDLYLHQFFVMGVFHGDYLGVLSPSVDRRLARESIGAILADYAGRPLSDWSLGDVLVRIMRLGRMQHSLGPRIFGELPLLAAIGYALALWFTLRIVRGIAAADRDASVGRGSS